MSPPRRPSQRRVPGRANNRERNAGTWIGVGATCLCLAALIGLAGMVLGPWVLAGVGLIALFVGTIALHYVVWGKWLGNQSEIEDESDGVYRPTRD